MVDLDSEICRSIIQRLFIENLFLDAVATVDQKIEEEIIKPS